MLEQDALSKTRHQDYIACRVCLLTYFETLHVKQCCWISLVDGPYMLCYIALSSVGVFMLFSRIDVLLTLWSLLDCSLGGNLALRL